MGGPALSDGSVGGWGAERIHRGSGHSFRAEEASVEVCWLTRPFGPVSLVDIDACFLLLFSLKTQSIYLVKVL